jgi:recombination protein RecT
MSELTKPYDVFKEELAGRRTELTSLLPSTLSAEEFINTAIIAVKKNPDLLRCDRRSLHNAISAAAFDGLKPDGKEGVIIQQWEKVKINGREQSILTARWQPMTHGIRKRARELDDILIDTSAVHANDSFDYELGDNPFIHHKPAPLFQPRGEIIGCYAIFRKDGVILHREVMSRADVEQVKSISKQPDGLMWTKFEGEAYRKSVVRRGIKSVPSTSPRLKTIVERFDELHTIDLDDTPPPLPAEDAPRHIEANSTPAVDTRAAQRQRMIALRGGKAAAGTIAPEPTPEPERSPEEMALDEIGAQLDGGADPEAVEAEWAGRIMRMSQGAREAAIDKIRRAKEQAA